MEYGTIIDKKGFVANDFFILEIATEIINGSVDSGDTESVVRRRAACRRHAHG